MRQNKLFQLAFFLTIAAWFPALVSGFIYFYERYTLANVVFAVLYLLVIAAMSLLNDGKTENFLAKRITNDRLIFRPIWRKLVDLTFGVAIVWWCWGNPFWVVFGAGLILTVVFCVWIEVEIIGATHSSADMQRFAGLGVLSIILRTYALDNKIEAPSEAYDMIAVLWLAVNRDVIAVSGTRFTEDALASAPPTEDRQTLELKEIVQQTLTVMTEAQTEA